jgi:CRISPR/Cas system-associated protein Csm6
MTRRTATAEICKPTIYKLFQTGRHRTRHFSILVEYSLYSTNTSLARLKSVGLYANKDKSPQKEKLTDLKELRIANKYFKQEF